MNRNKFVSLIFATLEPYTARVVIQLPNGDYALVRGVTSANGEVIIQTTTDAREEIV